nr:ABC transporter substrate-binding protein [Cellulosilyticum ruminicola]
MRRNWLKKIAVMTLCMASIVGCGNTNTTNDKVQTATKSKETTIGVTSFADTLEPTEQYFSWVVSRYGVGETLVRFDQEGEMVPCLAESWENSGEGKVWTFKIREGVKFSNGEEMTAESVKSSLERTFEKSTRAKDFFEPESIEVNGRDLIITTKTPVATLTGSLADPLFLIVDTNADQDKFATDGPICTGPYVVESFNPTNDCVVVRNEYYWNGEVPFDRVTFKCIDDQTTRSMALQTGEVQLAYNLKTENLATFENNDAYNIQSLASLRSTYAFMNQNGALGDIKLRQALVRSLDKKHIVNLYLKVVQYQGKRQSHQH